MPISLQFLPPRRPVLPFHSASIEREMDGGSGTFNPRTAEEVFRDFRGRRAGMIKALTNDVEKFFELCDPDVRRVLPSEDEPESIRKALKGASILNP